MSKIESINLLVNTKDKIKILEVCLAGILQRQQTKRDEKILEINKCFTGESPVEDLNLHVRSIIDSYVTATSEISALEEYMISVCSPSDTEVLKNLTDLKEDSLGVDGGGE